MSESRIVRNRTRALDLWSTLARRFSQDRRGATTVGHLGPRSTPTFSWPYGQVLVAAIDLDALDQPAGGPGPRSTPVWAGLERYRTGEGYADSVGGHDRYFDDNAWIGLAAIQAHGLRTDPDHPHRLDLADRTFRYVASGETAGGGVWWRDHPRECRNACSTLPAAALALRIHRHRPDPTLVDFAHRQVTWTDRHLVDGTGLVADNIDNAGVVEPTVWAYNQGSYLAAATLLAEATGDGDLHRAARRTATATLDRLGGDGWWHQPPAFVGVGFRNLLALAAVERLGDLADGLDPDVALADRIIGELDAYLDRVWADARDPHTGWCTAGGIAAYDVSPVLDQAVLVQLFALSTFPLAWMPHVS